MKPSMRSALLALSLLVVLAAVSQAHAQTASINVTDIVNQTSSMYAEDMVNYSIILGGISGNFSVPIPVGSHDISVSIGGKPVRFSYANTTDYLMLKLAGLSSGDRLSILFTYLQKVNTNDSYYVNTYYFIPPSFTSYFRLEMLLPEGAYAVSTNSVNNYEPPVYGFFTNGKRIEAEWILEKQTFTPNLYVIIPFYIGYRLTLPVSQQGAGAYTLYIAIAVIAVVLAAFAVLLSKKRLGRPRPAKVKRTRSNPFRMLLNADEKRILNMIPRDGFVIQSEIVRKSGSSKAKVSKIVSKLSRYRFIKVVPEGRNNRLKRN